MLILIRRKTNQHLDSIIKYKHVPILTSASEAREKSIGENQLECVCMYGSTP